MDAAAELAALWGEAYLRLAARAAHEIRNPLNAVAVNVEVVRLRAARGTADAMALPFADAAATELERAAARIEALLALARPAGEPVDVAGPLGHLVTLYAPIAAAEGGAMVVESTGAGWPTPTAAPAAAVRVVLAAVLDRLVGARAEVACAVTAAGEAPVVRVHGAPSAPALAPALAAAAAAAGIGIVWTGEQLVIQFPRAGAVGEE